MARVRYDRLAETEIGETIELARSEANHLFKILRTRTGECVGLLDGAGTIGTAVAEDGRMLRLKEKKTVPFPERKIHLYLAPPRRQKMDQLLKEATELGVYRIVPMICEHSVALPDADSADRQKELLFEACKQSSNPYLPKLESPLRFADAVQDAVRQCSRIFFGSPYEHAEQKEPAGQNIGFFVGPEGGFSEKEEKAMFSAGFIPMRIGPWILRVETAAVAGIARLWNV